MNTVAGSNLKSQVAYMISWSWCDNH